MADKVQGEGDYESARHYNEGTKKFVEERKRSGEPLKGDASNASDELTPEEKEALSRSRGAGQDRKDAELISEKEQRQAQK